MKISEFRDITRKTGSVVAYCKRNVLGIILKKERGLYIGRKLLADGIDCEYRITQVKNAKLGGRWQSEDPDCIGFIPADETKRLLAGETVNRGCK